MNKYIKYILIYINIHKVILYSRQYCIQHLLRTTDTENHKLLHRYTENGSKKVSRPKGLWTYQYLRRRNKPQIGLQLVSAVAAALPLLYQLLILEMERHSLYISA